VQYLSIYILTVAPVVNSWNT